MEGQQLSSTNFADLTPECGNRRYANKTDGAHEHGKMAVMKSNLGHAATFRHAYSSALPESIYTPVDFPQYCGGLLAILL